MKAGVFLSLLVVLTALLLNFFKVDVYNAVIGLPATVLFLVAYYARVDLGHPLLEMRDKAMDFFVENMRTTKYRNGPVAEIDARAPGFDAKSLVAQIKVLSDNWREPVVVRGLFAGVPATQNWQNLSYFEQFGDDEYLVLTNAEMSGLLEVAKKTNEHGAGFALSSMPLKEIIQGLREGKKYYINNLDTIFRRHNSLIQEIGLSERIPQWWYGQNKAYEPVSVQMFLGMGSGIDNDKTTGSPMHAARHGNLFVQLVGDKQWTFIDPAYALACYPALRYHIPAGACGFKAREHIKSGKLPTQRAVLHAGDMLFNPPWRLHEIANGEGLNIGVATRESMFLATVRNNPLFTFAQELADINGNFMLEAKRPVARFLAQLPFFGLVKGLTEEAVFGYSSPIRIGVNASTNHCDEHMPVCPRGFTEVNKKFHSAGGAYHNEEQKE